mmetsp:Transcript_14743/g.42088  ORF Transcript_14743/g.42088 Transcript_14743/m.42088 type:complete len:201 (-) Transcript_14743:550-1152(-)
MWEPKTCLIQVIVYSASFSTNSIGSQLLNKGPRSANSGMVLRVSSNSDFKLSPSSALLESTFPTTSTGTSSFSGTAVTSKASSMGVFRYSWRDCSKPARDTFLLFNTAGGLSSSFNSFRYIVALSLTSSSLSESVLLRRILMRSFNAGTLIPKFASDETAAALTVAFSKIILLYMYLMYLAGCGVRGPSSPRRCKICVER